MIRLALAAAAFAAFAVPTFAQEALCFQNGNFLVIAQERSEDVGMNILARAPARGKIKCEYAEREGDFLVNPDGEPLWYQGLASNYLVLTRSTGPDGDIVIYDLANQSLFIDEPADDEVTVADDTVTFWQRTKAGTAKNCPEFGEYTANGLGAIIAEERVLDVASGEVTATGEKRCTATQ
ncbi:hypothetical protein [Devosia sp.]|uniref:hypothetical protein n=1 Tax=Devosia sp. TaxID=1871048 RepID=UPI0025F19777|nr:hypothetical protein [Devosia sp.]MCR6634524.1 hypothetical protein [Devosia sp.]